MTGKGGTQLSKLYCYFSFWRFVSVADKSTLATT